MNVRGVVYRDIVIFVVVLFEHYIVFVAKYNICIIKYLYMKYA